MPKKNTKKPKVPPKKYASLEEAAAHCDVTPTTLRNHIKRYEDLPIKQRGDRFHSWQIDLDALDAWRDQTGFLKKEARNADDPPGPRQTSVSRRKDVIQADLLQLELNLRTTKVVDKEATVKLFKTACAKLAKGLDMIPTIMGKKLGWTPEVIEIARKMHNDCRNAMVAEIDAYFAKLEAENQVGNATVPIN